MKLTIDTPELKPFSWAKFKILRKAIVHADACTPTGFKLAYTPPEKDSHLLPKI